MQGYMFMKTGNFKIIFFCLLSIRYALALSSYPHRRKCSAVITYFDNFFLTYNCLTKPAFKKGDFIKSGQIIANLDHDYDDRFRVDIYFSNPIKIFDPAQLFG